MKNDAVDFSNDSWLEELAGGNLQGDQYCQALQVLEAQPQRWRDCALAFLQEQALTQELKGLAQGDVSWRDSHDPTSALDSTQPRTPAIAAPRALHTATQDSQGVVSLGLVGQAQGQTQFNARIKWLQHLTSLAAMLLISFTIGWVGSDVLSKSGAPPKEPTVDLARKGGAVSGFGPASQAATDPLLSSNFSQGDFRLAAERFVPIDREVPEELRELERRGMIRIESSDAFLPMDLGNGSSAIVPVQQYRVTPVIYTY